MPILHDPIEDSEAYLAIKDELEQEIALRIGSEHRGMGFCHLYWSVKKEILLTKYHIKWKSPAQMNPGVLFD